MQADPQASANLQDLALAALHRTVFEEDRRSVEKLLKAGQLAAARAVLARAARRADGTTDVEAYAGLKEHVDDYEVRAQAIRLYQAAKWQELRELAQDYLDRNPQGGFAKSARGLKRTAEEKLRPAPDLSAAGGAGGADESGSSTPMISFIVNRHWHGFDRHLFALGDEIQAAWTKNAPPEVSVHAGLGVTVIFVETNEGVVTRIVRHRAPDGIPDAVTQACIAAVKNGGPFDKWNESMSIELGDSQMLIACFNF